MSNEQRLNGLFNQAKELPSAYSFNEMSTRFTASVSSGATSPKRNLFSTKNVLIMLAITSIAVTTLLLIAKPTEESTADQKSVPTSDRMEQTPNGVTPSVSERQQTHEAKRPFQSIVKLVDEASVQVAETTSEQLEEEGYQILFPLSKPKLVDDEYQFPKLTEEEISANNKRKRSMLKSLEKFDKKQYAYIPSGTFEYDGKTTSVQAFYMQKAEVSNLEYRTFLFDLLIQDRKEDFLKAKPDQTQWVAYFNGGMQAYQDYYFSHVAYDDYPVVNISKLGAEMYCKWLSEELNTFVDEKKQKNYNDVRIPTRTEWVKAASNEGKQLPYPWDGQFMRNSEGLYLANFTRSVTDTSGTDYDLTTSDVTAPVTSFWPNALGLYNMAGNVAELVYETSDKSTVGTAGGSWRNKEEELKILAPDPYKGKVSPMPTIGFRVVMTVLKTN